MQTSQGYIFRTLQHFVTKFCNLLILISSFREFTFFCLDQKSKISLTCKLSIDWIDIEGRCLQCRQRQTAAV